jgi:very-short-patch-repair endonuclease
MRGANVTKTSLARQLRKNSTRAERKLWRHLRSRSLDGFKFVRQEPIGPYVVDFVCREQRLVIEVDGGQHAESRCDAMRDQWLVAHRYRVLRFWNNEVLGNIEGVWDTILAAASAAAPPHPSLSPRAGRGSRQAEPPNENAVHRMQRRAGNTPRRSEAEPR